MHSAESQLHARSSPCRRIERTLQPRALSVRAWMAAHTAATRCCLKHSDEIERSRIGLKTGSSRTRLFDSVMVDVFANAGSDNYGILLLAGNAAPLDQMSRAIRVKEKVGGAPIAGKL